MSEKGRGDRQVGDGGSPLCLDPPDPPRTQIITKKGSFAKAPFYSKTILSLVPLRPGHTGHTRPIRPRTTGVQDQHNQMVEVRGRGAKDGPQGLRASPNTPGKQVPPGKVGCIIPPSPPPPTHTHSPHVRLLADLGHCGAQHVRLAAARGAKEQQPGAQPQGGVRYEPRVVQGQGDGLVEGLARIVHAPDVLPTTHLEATAAAAAGRGGAVWDREGSGTGYENLKIVILALGFYMIMLHNIYMIHVYMSMCDA